MRMSMAAKVLMSTADMSRDEWVDARRKGLGGSDAAVVMGVSPWTSLLELYLDKTGEMPEKKQTWAMRRGVALEPALADWFAEEFGVKVWRRNAILHHPDHPWMLANIDRRVVGEDVGVEIKTVSSFSYDRWKDGKAPIEYVLQCMHYMAVTGYTHWWLVYVIDGREPEAILLERDEEAIDALIEAESKFWHNHVIAKVPPKPDASDSARRALDHMFHNPEPKSVIELPDEAAVWIGQKNEASRTIKEAKEQEEFAKNMLKSLMGNAEIGTLYGEQAVTWKQGKKGRTLLIKGAWDE